MIRAAPGWPTRGSSRSGVLLGLSALTRNETAWLALIWVGIAWFATVAPTDVRVRLIGVVAVVALVVFAPWAYRNWVVLGSPLPSQAPPRTRSSCRGIDIFAWNDPPTLARYLAQGPAALLELRWMGPRTTCSTSCCSWDCRSRWSASWACRGCGARSPSGRCSCWRPSCSSSRAWSFPPRPTWGTFLHSAGPVHVLLIVMRAVRTRRSSSPGSASGAAGHARWPGLDRPLPSRGRRSSRSRSSQPSERLPHRRLASTRHCPRGWRQPDTHSTQAPARSSRTSRSGWPRRRASTRSPCRTSYRPTSSTWPRPFAGAHLLVVVGDDHGDGRRSWTPTCRGPSASPRSIWDRRRPASARTRWPMSMSMSSAAHESRPVYSDVDGCRTCPDRGSRHQPGRLARARGCPGADRAGAGRRAAAAGTGDP